ncbi:MAG: hypothetical protein HC888_08690 [Candidatus Competibacteraceae bacterium]|nr:hypothetical protein [Candidatus Competibacteraceae bacterium]
MDGDNNPLTFAWIFLSRPAGSAAALNNTTAVTPSFTIDEPGNYTLQLVVNDGSQASNPDTVTVSTTNSAPVANAGPDRRFQVGDTVTLDGSASSDVDDNPLTFAWSFTSRPAGSAASITNATQVTARFEIDVPGTYVVQLVVNDGAASSPADTVSISTDNSPPVANAGPDRTVPVTGLAVLDGGNSSDVDDDPLTYAWSFTSRPAGSTAALVNPAAVNPRFTVDVPGNYVVRLIVNDGTVNSESDTITISTSNSRAGGQCRRDRSGQVNQTVTPGPAARAMTPTATPLPTAGASRSALPAAPRSSRVPRWSIRNS